MRYLDTEGYINYIKDNDNTLSLKNFMYNNFNYTLVFRHNNFFAGVLITGLDNYTVEQLKVDCRFKKGLFDEKYNMTDIKKLMTDEDILEYFKHLALEHGVKKATIRTKKGERYLHIVPWENDKIFHAHDVFVDAPDIPDVELLEKLEFLGWSHFNTQVDYIDFGIKNNYISIY